MLIPKGWMPQRCHWVLRYEENLENRWSSVHIVRPCEKEQRKTGKSQISVFHCFLYFIYHTNHSFLSFLPSHSLPPTPFYLPHSLLCHLHSDGVRSYLGINKPWHIRLRQDQALFPYFLKGKIHLRLLLPAWLFKYSLNFSLLNFLYLYTSLKILFHLCM